MKLVFEHGWGFDAGVWDGVIALLPGFACVVADRGYFGAAVVPRVDGECVLVAHSHGVMRGLRVIGKPLRGAGNLCRGMVALGGFDRFVAGPDVAGIPARVLDRMLARLANAPEAVVAEFRQRCGWDGPFGAVDVAWLEADLRDLREGDCRREAAAFGGPILSLAGADDPILPQALRDGVFAGAARAERRGVAGAGHLLPLTHAELCAAAIAEFVERLA